MLIYMYIYLSCPVANDRTSMFILSFSEDIIYICLFFVYKTACPVANNLIVIYSRPCSQVKQKAISMISIVITRGRISKIV